MFRFLKKIVATEIAELIYMTQQYVDAMSEDEPSKPRFGFTLPDTSTVERDIDASADRNTSVRIRN